MPPLDSYLSLCQRQREIQLLGTTASLLNWDQETFLPPSAAPYRAEQLAALSSLTHRMATSEEVQRLLEESEAIGFPNDSVEFSNVRQIRRNFDRAMKIPNDLVEEFARICSHGHHAWVAARQKSDFSLFAPHLSKILEFTRRKAEYWGYPDHPYDALLEGYEPGMTTREVRLVLEGLAPQQSNLLSAISNHQATQAIPTISGHFPENAQRQFNQEVAAAFGFDFQAGRIDATAHPFCTTLGPRDVRLTTRYDLTDFTQSLYSVLHEAGHGLYEQGLPVENFGLPSGESVSLGIHESQSRLWENKIGRTRAFWDHWLPRAQELFPDARSLTPESITASVLRVKPSFIRVEADEVSYDLHIALRFELELALVEGSLPVEEVPSAWNARFHSLFGLTVPDDARGCLQDIHWSMGGIGYFSTYTLGNLNSAQLFEAALASSPTIGSDLANGQYASILNWMRTNIHQHGQRWSAPELIERATGQRTQNTAHLRYLESKYLSA
jgi:carboxypeptidase Taq